MSDEGRAIMSLRLAARLPGYPATRLPFSGVGDSFRVFDASHPVAWLPGYENFMVDECEPACVQRFGHYLSYSRTQR